MYVQLPCEIPISLKETRHLFGLLAGCIGVFVYLYVLVYIDFVKTCESTKFVDWDVKTVTAGDYSIEFDLNKGTFGHWKKYYCDETSLLSECAQFKLYLQKELERRCTAIENQGYEAETPDNPFQVKIAQITLAYDNALIIKRLYQRGMLIKKEKWEKVYKKNS